MGNDKEKFDDTSSRGITEARPLLVGSDKHRLPSRSILSDGNKGVGYENSECLSNENDMRGRFRNSCPSSHYYPNPSSSSRGDPNGIPAGNKNEILLDPNFPVSRTTYNQIGETPSHSALSTGEVGRRIDFKQNQRLNDDIDTSVDFHRKLVAAILRVGIRHASPSKIADNMISLPKYDLKKEQLKSHLQRFRKSYDDVEEEAFLDDYDRFQDVINRLENHNRRAGSFAVLDMRTAIGGRSAALLSHLVRTEFANKIKAQQYNILDHFGFFNSPSDKDQLDDHQKHDHINSQERGKSPPRDIALTHDDKNQTRSFPLYAPIMRMKKDNSELGAMCVRAPHLTDEEKTTSLGLALRHTVGLIQQYANHLNSARQLEYARGKKGEKRGLDMPKKQRQNMASEPSVSDKVWSDPSKKTHKDNQRKEYLSNVASVYGEHIENNTIPYAPSPAIDSHSTSLASNEPILRSHFLRHSRRGLIRQQDKDSVTNTLDSDLDLLHVLDLVKHKDERRQLSTLQRLVEQNDELRRENEMLKREQQDRMQPDDERKDPMNRTIFIDDSDDSSVSSVSTDDEDGHGNVVDERTSQALDRMQDLSAWLTKQSHKTIRRHNTALTIGDNDSISTIDLSSGSIAGNFDTNLSQTSHKSPSSTLERLRFKRSKRLRLTYEMDRTKSQHTNGLKDDFVPAKASNANPEFSQARKTKTSTRRKDKRRKSAKQTRRRGASKIFASSKSIEVEGTDTELTLNPNTPRGENHIFDFRAGTGPSVKPQWHQQSQPQPQQQQPQQQWYQSERPLTQQPLVQMPERLETLGPSSGVDLYRYHPPTQDNQNTRYTGTTTNHYHQRNYIQQHLTVPSSESAMKQAKNPEDFMMALLKHDRIQQQQLQHLRQISSQLEMTHHQRQQQQQQHIGYSSIQNVPGDTDRRTQIRPELYQPLDQTQLDSLSYSQSQLQSRLQSQSQREEQFGDTAGGSAIGADDTSFNSDVLGALGRFHPVDDYDSTINSNIDQDMESNTNVKGSES